MLVIIQISTSTTQDGGIMGLFDRKRQPRKGRIRPRTPEEIEKDKKAKVGSFLADQSMKEAGKDPDLLRKMISKEFSLDLPEVNSGVKRREKLEQMLDDKAMDALSNKPELFERFAMARVAKLTGDKIRPEDMGNGGSGEEFEGDGYGSGDSTDEFMERYERIEEFKTKHGLGGGNNGGIIVSILNSEFGKALGENFGAIFAQMMANKGAGNAPAGNGQPRPVYVVEVNGKMVGLDEQQFMKLRNEGKLQPAKLIEEPKTEATQTATEIAETQPQTGNVETNIPPFTDKPLPEFLKDVDFEEMFAYLKQSPEDFINTLRVSEDMKAQFILGYLPNTTYEKLLEIVEPYRNHSEVGEYVQALYTPESKAWIESVIALSKDKE
jgi:hypothetical protein